MPRSGCGELVVVFEQASELREVGAGLTLWPGTVSALEQVGVADPVREIGVLATGGRLLTPRGQVLYQGSLLTCFRGWHEPVEAVVAATEEAAILRNDIYDRDPLPRWSEGRVTLLGDAAHPMTPDLGQGACQAIEDAAALAESLREAGDGVVSALRAYEALRLPRANAIVRQSRRMGRFAQLQNPLACRLRDLFVRATPERLRRRQLEWIVGARG